MKLKEVLKYFYFLDDCQVFVITDSNEDPAYIGDIYGIPWRCTEFVICEEFGIGLKECVETGREILTFYVKEI